VNGVIRLGFNMLRHWSHRIFV